MSNIEFEKRKSIEQVEESTELASMFNARSLPTVVMIRKNGQKEQGIGVMNEATLKYWLEGLISN